MRLSERITAGFMVVAGLSGLTACDPGYDFTIHNPCDAPMTVDLRDSDEFGRSGTGGAVTVASHSTNSWSQIDPHINPPFGVLLLDGPREGELIESDEPDVTIPESACPR
jgi:hypothetical protein